MPRSLVLFLFCFFAQFTHAQTAPRFAKYPVAETGFYIYLPAEPGPVTMEYSPDSAKVYTIEAVDSSQGKYFHFGAIVALMNGVDLAGQEDSVLTKYLDYLKGAFSIKSSAGYGYGHTLSTHPSAHGIIDYWGDKDGDEWKINAWAAEHAIVVQFEYGPSEYPIYNVMEIFGKAIRFPGD